VSVEVHGAHGPVLVLLQADRVFEDALNVNFDFRQTVLQVHVLLPIQFERFKLDPLDLTQVVLVLQYVFELLAHLQHTHDCKVLFDPQIQFVHIECKQILTLKVFNASKLLFYEELEYVPVDFAIFGVYRVQ